MITWRTDHSSIDWLIDWLSESLYVCNKLNTPWKVCLYGTCIYAPIGLSQKSYLFLALSFSISVITNTCVNSIQREILFCILYMYVHVDLFWEFNSLKNIQGLERTTKHEFLFSITLIRRTFLLFSSGQMSDGWTSGHSLKSRSLSRCLFYFAI